VPSPALLWKLRRQAQASGLVEAGGATECAVQAAQLSLLSVALYVLVGQGVQICVEKK
jgi:hypothetical protein